MNDFLGSNPVCTHNLNYVSFNHDFRTPWIIKFRVAISRKKNLSHSCALLDLGENASF